MRKRSMGTVGGQSRKDAIPPPDLHHVRAVVFQICDIRNCCTPNDLSGHRNTINITEIHSVEPGEENNLEMHFSFPRFGRNSHHTSQGSCHPERPAEKYPLQPILRPSSAAGSQGSERRIRRSGRRNFRTPSCRPNPQIP